MCYRASSVGVVNVGNKEDLKKRVLEESDFVRSYKFGNSLSKFLSRNTKDLDDSAIARLLMIEKSEVEEIYQKAVEMLKKGMDEEKTWLFKSRMLGLVQERYFMTETELDRLLKEKHVQIDDQLQDQLRGQLWDQLGVQLWDQGNP